MTNTNPEISINKLGEFLFASAAKKRSILKTFKFPSTFKIARYSTPKSAFVDYMLDEHHDTNIFKLKRELVLLRKADTPWKVNTIQCCLQAIEDLLQCTGLHLVPYLQYKAQAGLPRGTKSRNIENVTVHIAPDIILLDKKTQKIAGGIKLVFSKSRAVDFQEGVAISCIVKDHIEKIYGAPVSGNNCITIDVFHRRCIPASENAKPIADQVKKACREISELWPTIPN